MPIGAQAMLALVQFARGRGAVAHQLYADGYDQLSRILDPNDVAYHPFVGSWALSDLIESAANVGRVEEARRHLAELERARARDVRPAVARHARVLETAGGRRRRGGARSTRPRSRRD